MLFPLDFSSVCTAPVLSGVRSAPLQKFVLEKFQEKFSKNAIKMGEGVKKFLKMVGKIWQKCRNFSKNWSGNTGRSGVEKSLSLQNFWSSLRAPKNMERIPLHSAPYTHWILVHTWLHVTVRMYVICLNYEIRLDGSLNLIN